jgi:hypothetical protein
MIWRKSVFSQQGQLAQFDWAGANVSGSSLSHTRTSAFLQLFPSKNDPFDECFFIKRHAMPQIASEEVRSA